MFGNQGNYPAGCDFRATPYADGDEAALPDEVRVALDEMVIGPPEIIVSTPDWWAVIEPASGDVSRFEGKRGERITPPDWFAAAVKAWLATVEGQRSVQHWIDVAMEDA
jgi:hypothetical protein